MDRLLFLPQLMTLFDELPSGTVETLLKPENKAKLVSILTYHVASGKFTAAVIAAKADASRIRKLAKAGTKCQLAG